VRKDIPLHKFLRKMPGEKYVPAEGEATVCGVFLVTDDKTGLARSLAPMRIGPRLIPAMPA
jgi:calcineurin-like phosphoesterase